MRLPGSADKEHHRLNFLASEGFVISKLPVLFGYDSIFNPNVHRQNLIVCQMAPFDISLQSVIIE